MHWGSLLALFLVFDVAVISWAFLHCFGSVGGFYAALRRDLDPDLIGWLEPESPSRPEFLSWTFLLASGALLAAQGVLLQLLQAR